MISAKGSDKWHFPANSLGGTCALAWPAARMAMGSHAAYWPDANINPEGNVQIYVRDLDDWEAIKVKWIGSLEASVLA
eukprot:2560954-Lingulodinium_polyedra.AAC.1